MAYERLQALGEEKFGKIINLLMRGESALAVARMIQQPPPKGWSEFQDVAEKTLTQQVNRLRLDAADGFFGRKIGLRIKEDVAVPPQIKLLEGISVKVLGRLEELSEWQRDRVIRLMEREKQGMMPEGVKITPLEYRHLLTQTNMVFNDYKQLLLDLQKIRFELGLDEWKGPVATSVRGAAQVTSFPDGTQVHKQVFEAVNMVEEIFSARNIPK